MADRTNSEDYKSVYGTSRKDYIYNSGKHCIVVARGGSDTIYSDDSDYSSISGGSGNDIVLADDNDYVTVVGSSGKDTIAGYYYSSKIYGGSGNDVLKVYSGITNTIDGGAGKDTIVAYGGLVKGGSGNDLISGDSEAYFSATLQGGKGSDILSGGGGDDYLTGGTGNDAFIYFAGEGNDTVTDYKAGDMILIASGENISNDYTYSYSGKNVIFSIGGGSITVKNGKGKSINVNGSTKRYSSANASALLAENNFASVDNLSSIVKNNLAAVSEITMKSFDTLAQKDSVITFAAE